MIKFHWASMAMLVFLTFGCKVNRSPQEEAQGNSGNTNISGGQLEINAGPAAEPVPQIVRLESEVIVSANADQFCINNSAEPPVEANVADDGHRLLTGAGIGGGPHAIAHNGLSNVSPNRVLSTFTFDRAYPGGITVALADFNGDGVPEQITGAGRFIEGSPSTPSEVRIDDGKTSKLIARFRPFGDNVSTDVFVAAGDLNGDGQPEVVVGSGAGIEGQVIIFNVAEQENTDQLLVTPGNSFVPYPNFTGGVRVAVGNINNPNAVQIATVPGPGGGSHVKTFTPAGAEIFSFFIDSPASGLTVAMGNIVPELGAPRDELIIGTGADDQESRVLILTRDNIIDAQSTGDLPEGITVVPYPGFTGEIRVASANLDGAGLEELITGAGFGGGPHAITLSPSFDANNNSVSFSVLNNFFPYNPDFKGGIWVAGF